MERTVGDVFELANHDGFWLEVREAGQSTNEDIPRCHDASLKRCVFGRIDNCALVRERNYQACAGACGYVSKRSDGKKVVFIKSLPAIAAQKIGPRKCVVQFTPEVTIGKFYDMDYLEKSGHYRFVDDLGLNSYITEEILLKNFIRE